MNLKESEMRQLQKAIAGTKTALGEAAGKLRGVLQDAPMMAETPIEVGLAMELAVEAIGESLRRLDSVSLAKSLPAPQRSRQACPTAEDRAIMRIAGAPVRGIWRSSA